MSDTKNLVILGASYAGIPLAHKLLRVLPTNYKIYLISPSTHLYWNVASPRAFVKNAAFGPENAQLFHDLRTGFAESEKANKFQFVQAYATAVDHKANTVTIRKVSGEGEQGDEAVLVYDQLVVATGSDMQAQGKWPFKLVGTHLETRAAIKNMNARIEAANTIVLSGAGPTGVETAGEIATQWPRKKVILISSQDRPLAMVREAVGKSAQSQLESLGVVVKNGAKVTNEVDKGGFSELSLSTGEILHADLHIPTYGIKPNTSFLPMELKDQFGWVKTAKTLRSEVAENVWAIGDAASAITDKKVANIPAALIVILHNISAVLNGTGAVLKEYEQEKQMLVMAVPIGSRFAKGTGIMGSWRLWGIVVWAVKGRTYFIGNAKAYADGQKLADGSKV